MNKIFSAFYLVGMWVYTFLVWLASPFNMKAKQLSEGRRETWRKLRNYDNSQKCVWVHAASLGEFEQGRPLIEAIKKADPKRRVVLTFYSPSGFEIRKNYALADLVCYLPADGPINARRFIEAINPSAAYFVKYEFWHFFINVLRSHSVPLYGVSMIFRSSQPFFKPWGGWFRQMLSCFSHIYVQDAKSKGLLDGIGVSFNTVAGDTRFDRVSQIAQTAPEVDVAARFSKNADVVIVAGSTWPPDEQLLFSFVNKPDVNVKLIVAPHETHDERIKSLCANLSVPYDLFSKPSDDVAEKKVLVINTIGLLSAIYKYGNIAYVGGGFGKGIHNTLEPATYGMPVLFGPNHHKFKEAEDLKACGGGFAVTSQDDFNAVITSLVSSVEKRKKAGAAADAYCKSMCGATEVILHDTLPDIAGR